jgi:adenylate kinase family enzyme
LLTGGPASGKGTQCAELIKEFGYMHISTGDLMRDEVKKVSLIVIEKKTKDGERIKTLQAAGALVPAELTVSILLKGMIANPAKNYLIDGFPRALDQAL